MWHPMPSAAKLRARGTAVCPQLPARRERRAAAVRAAAAAAAAHTAAAAAAPAPTAAPATATAAAKAASTRRRAPRLPQALPVGSPPALRLCRSCTRRAVAAAAAAAAGPGPGALGEDVRGLALLMLINENLRRRTGRPLLPEGADALQLRAAAEGLGVAVALFGPAASGAEGGGGAGGTGGGDVDADGAAARAAQLLYANANAADALAGAINGGGGGGAPRVGDALLLPACSADATPSAGCIAADAVRWRLGEGGGSSSGGELVIDRLLVCPVTAPNDSPIGVALLFDAWRHPCDGALGRPGFPRVAPSELPGPEQLQAAANSVREQADAVRALKQQRGLPNPNQDPAVQAAVSELQRRKELLARFEGLAAAFGRAAGDGIAPWLAGTAAKPEGGAPPPAGTG
ncbi:hypothetical protein Rsub_12535 [Raphidocelis subcapitata]|uniref:Uncharacterized protein n=1 Tax=Raphidocelis subcapitata TaxID=307507 RepID=A0A2V0PRD7_9CHLO|nr:hypothetical protein Rsub_12535 [Raphidocelis subcapitata]|eukprot:GBF99835.1 hypothetical protein Rsub_12535 [Raphidocelis subcapitata]